MKNKKLIPEIRFPEFSGEWVEKRLGEIFIIKRGASPRPIKNYLSKDGINWIKIGDITPDSKYLTKTQEKITLNGAKKSVIVYPDDFILSNSMSFGRPYISKIEGCIHDGWLLLRKKTNFIDIEYLYYNLLTFTTQKKFKAIAAGSTVNNLKADSVKQIKIYIPPTLDEQKKIANFLSSIDEKIEIVSKKIKELKKYKKGMLQKLLDVKCNNGKCEPELRFKGFSGDWIEKRLGELIEECKTKNKNKQIENVLSISNKHGFVSQLDFFDKRVASNDISNYKIIKKGWFAYNPARINVGSIALLKKFTDGIISPMYIVFKTKTNLNNLFLNYWFNTHYFNEQLKKYLIGSVRQSLNIKDLKLMKIHLPPTLAEQQKIADFLSSIDEKIELNEKKVEKLKAYKQGLLQKMFV